MICRTCLKEISQDQCLQFPNENVGQEKIFKRINLCIPEMDLFSVTEPALCFDCIDALEKAYHFRRTCLRIEEEIINFICTTQDQGALNDKIDLKVFKSHFENCNKNVGPNNNIANKVIKSENITNDYNYLNDKIEAVCCEGEDNKKHLEPLLSLVNQMPQNTQQVTKTGTIIKRRPAMQGMLIKRKKPPSKFTDSKCMGCTNQSTDPTTHNKVYNGTFICGECNIVYDKISDIRKHIYKHTKPVVCNICNKRSRDLQQHKTHLRSHTDQKQFKCSRCNKGFKQKFALTQHEKIHNPDHAFKCVHCLRVCSTKYNLKIHMTMHTGKLHPCKYCGRKLLTNSILKDHIRRWCKGVKKKIKDEYSDDIDVKNEYTTDCKENEEDIQTGNRFEVQNRVIKNEDIYEDFDGEVFS